MSFFKTSVLFLGAVCLVSSPLTFSSETRSSVVQVVSYSDIFGTTPQMQGWGSASIIDDKGTLLSNNHVVTDSKGNLVSALAVCVSESVASRPVCRYVADVIAHDKDIDLSVLRIRPKDIFGVAVDFSKLPKTEIDWSYTAPTQDDVVAIGYPWIGADTVTETKGIVSGITEYNGYKYIKTDTTIAGGNSGGGLFRNGKLIGVPTFGIGGWGENSLGYALLISEGKEFIEKHMKWEVMENPAPLEITQLLKKWEESKKNRRFTDDIFDLTLPEGYIVTDYTPSDRVTISTEKNGELTVSTTIQIIGVPTSLEKTDAALERYIKNANLSANVWYYYGGAVATDAKIEKVTIGGKSFLKVRGPYATARENSLYIGRLSDNTLAIISPYIYGPESVKDSVIQSTEDSIIRGVGFSTGASTKLVWKFALENPQLSFESTPNGIVDLRMGQARYFMPTKKSPSREIGIDVSARYYWTGSGVDGAMNDDWEYRGAPASLKGKVTVQGREGYAFCEQSSSNATDPMTGKGYQRRQCTVKITEGINGKRDGETFVISIRLSTNGATISEDFESLIDFLKTQMQIGDGSGETKIVNFFTRTQPGVWSDLGGQSQDYRDRLITLSSWGLLQQRASFDPLHVMTWGEYIDLMVRFKYGLDSRVHTRACWSDYMCRFGRMRLPSGPDHETVTTLLSALKPLKVDLVGRMSSDWSATNDFETLLSLSLAGEPTIALTKLQLQDIRNRLTSGLSTGYTPTVSSNTAVSGLSEEVLSQKARAIDTWNDLYFGKANSSTTPSITAGYFASTGSIVMDDRGRIFFESIGFSERPTFTQIVKPVNCDKTNKLSLQYKNNCASTYRVYLLTRIDAIDRLSNNADLTFLDPDARTKRDGGDFSKYITISSGETSAKASAKKRTSPRP